MTRHDRDAWEARWEQALATHGERLADLAPSQHLTAAAADLAPGRALDAGCGHGAETRWLAARGWTVTAVDFSATALAQARAVAGADAQVTWVEADLGLWSPAPAAFDLVVCVHVHVQGPVPAFVARMAAGVARGGTLLVVGRQGIDQVQPSGDDVRTALDPAVWTVDAREEPLPAGGADAVVRAVRSV